MRKLWIIPLIAACAGIGASLIVRHHGYTELEAPSRALALAFVVLGAVSVWALLRTLPQFWRTAITASVGSLFFLAALAPMGETARDELMPLTAWIMAASAVLLLAGANWLRRFSHKRNNVPYYTTNVVADLVIIGAGFFLLILLPVMVGPWDQPSFGAFNASKSNLRQIARAMEDYSADNGGYFPFDERGPLYSLALLYPRYIKTPATFQDPVLNHSLRFRNLSVPFPAGSSLSGALCGYGFTWRVSPNPRPGFAMAGELGPLMANRGGYVLYADGSVIWRNDPFSSFDPLDNIYAPEPGWSADTDSFIRQR